MENTGPVDLNKLKHILGNAKSVMKALDEKEQTRTPKNKISESVREDYDDYNAPQIQSPLYDESDEREPDYSMPYAAKNVQQGYSTEQVMSSKLPPVIKEAMLKNPIPQLSFPPSKFTAEDLGDLVKPKKPQRVNENVQKSDMITISRNELNALIDNRVNQILAEKFVKTISEQSMKKTIAMLLKEGKISNRK
jgi:hypothetical protein